MGPGPVVQYVGGQDGFRLFLFPFFGCDIFCLISRYMRPEGPWQRLRRCLSNGSENFYMTMFLSQTDIVGPPLLLLPKSASLASIAGSSGARA